MTLFHEIYGGYYHAVSCILREALQKTLTRKKMIHYIHEQAFGESLMTIPEKIIGESWRLLHKDFTTPLQNDPVLPLTTIEKRWIKALLADPRIKLFDPDFSGLEDVEPLFTPDNFVYYDRYTDGDPYNDDTYIEHFRTVIHALQEGYNLFVSYKTRLDKIHEAEVTPHFLEYSEKNDRFRLIASNKDWNFTINLSRILQCKPLIDYNHYPFHQLKKASVTFELEDTRKAMERVMMHFSHLEKETKRLDDIHYRVTLCYDQSDETEMVIEILSFGPFIRVTEPDSFIELLRERLCRQKELSS